MNMKIGKFLVVALILVGLNFSFSFAQVLNQGGSGGVVNPPPPQCADSKDNDGDKLIDKEGKGTIKADPQCQVEGAICEDGSKTCISTTPAEEMCGSGLCLKVKINNPLKVETIQGAIQLFMNAVLKIALPFIVVFFIWSGLSFVLARGNPEKIKTAKNMFLYTIIGTLLILGAWTITNAIIGTVNSITG